MRNQKEKKLDYISLSSGGLTEFCLLQVVFKKKMKAQATCYTLLMKDFYSC